MNRNKYFKYLRFDRLFTVVKLKQPSILWLAFLVSWFDNNSIYMWVVPCSPPKPRVLICCARPSHLKHWNSWKASAGPALHLAASPTSVCTSAHAVLSLPLSATASSGPCHRSHEVHGPLHFIGLGQQCQVSAVRPRTPLKCPRQRQTLHRAGAVTTIAFLQGPFLPLQRNPVSASSHTALGTCALLSISLPIWTLAITWDLWVWLLVLGAFVRSLDHVSIVCSLNGRLASMYEPHGVYPSVTDAFIHLLVVRNIYVWTELQLIQKVLPGSGVQLWES